MSNSKRSVVVSRIYNATPDDCVRALELLLEKPVRKKGGCGTAHEDAERSLNDGARIIIQESK